MIIDILLKVIFKVNVDMNVFLNFIFVNNLSIKIIKGIKIVDFKFKI